VVLVRDTKDRAGVVLTFGLDAWMRFAATIKSTDRGCGRSGAPVGTTVLTGPLPGFCPICVADLCLTIVRGYPGDTPN
jgi:hypothetical protein